MTITPAPLDGIDLTPLPELIRRHGATRPDATALIAGETRLSWGAFATEVGAVAGWLQRRGIGRGSVVASIAGLSPAHLVLYMAVLTAGAAMAPLPATAHPDGIAAMLANAAPALVVTDTPDQAGAGPGAMTLDEVMRAAGTAPAPSTRIAPGDLFDIIYSSGTTGAPKGIEHDHAFRLRQIARFATHGFDAGAVSLVSTPLYSNTTLTALLPALAGGGCIVLMAKFDAGGFLALAQRHRVSHAMLVPVQYRRLLAHPDFDRTDLSAFRTKLSTSAPFPAPLMAEVLRRWPGSLLNLYGMTEGGVSVVLDARAFPDKLHTAGRPVRGAEVRILSAEGRELPPGETGEIVGRSATMMTAYRDDEARTRAAVWVSPEGTDFIRTGDMGRLDPEGFLVLMDRSKDMINSGGFNVFPADLEAVLTSHPQVSEAAVVAIPDPEWGETPLAIVVASGIEAEALRSWANARLGKTQRIARLEIRTELPRNEIGKVLKRDLRAPYWETAT